MADTKYVHIDWKDMYKDELAQELATERVKVLSEVEEWVKGMMSMYEHNIGFEGEAFCERCKEVVSFGSPCTASRFYEEWERLQELVAILNQLKEGG